MVVDWRRCLANHTHKVAIRQKALNPDYQYDGGHQL